MNAQAALEKYDALCDLTRNTGMVTKHARNTLLNSLTPEVLMDVAVELKKRDAVGKILSGARMNEKNEGMKGTVNAAGTAKL